MPGYHAVRAGSGPGVGAREPAELAHGASTPPEKHLLRLEGVSDADVAYARAFPRPS